MVLQRFEGRKDDSMTRIYAAQRVEGLNCGGSFARDVRLRARSDARVSKEVEGDEYVDLHSKCRL